MQELDHQTGEALEGTRNAHGRADFDQNAFGGVDVDLQLSGLVDGGVEEGEKALSSNHVSYIDSRVIYYARRVSYLMSDVRTRITNIAVHFPHHANMLIAVE